MASVAFSKSTSDWDAHTAHWRILVDPAVDEPAGSPLRKLLIQPVARMSLDPTATSVDLLHGQWEVCIPTNKITHVTVRSSGRQVPTWQSAMGLGGKFADKLRYSEMHVTVPQDVRGLLDADIEGAYDLLEQCGTACGALHVRRGGQDAAARRRLFLFIDTDRFQDASADRYLFSTDTLRWPYPLQRVCVAQLEPGWRPALAKPDHLGCLAQGRAFLGASRYWRGWQDGDSQTDLRPGLAPGGLHLFGGSVDLRGARERKGHGPVLACGWRLGSSGSPA